MNEYSRERKHIISVFTHIQREILMIHGDLESFSNWARYESTVVSTGS